MNKLHVEKRKEKILFTYELDPPSSKNIETEKEKTPFSELNNHLSNYKFMAETRGLVLFEILEQNMNNNNTDDSKNSLKYVLISCIPRSSTSTFFPYLLFLSIRYPLR